MSCTNVVDVDVVVVGSGPAGMAATSVLLGYHPVYLGGHPDHDFDRTMKESLSSSPSSSNWILDATDLGSLTKKLKGRSNNPIALLGDHLWFPYVDQGMQLPSCVTIKYRKDRALNVVMIGEDIGGSWNQFPPQTMTLSPGSWMSLPFWPMLESSNSTVIEGRIPREFVSSYYCKAFKEQLQHVYTAGKVTRVTPLVSSNDNGTNNLSTNDGGGWKVIATTQNSKNVSSTMTWKAQAVILATGSYSKTKKLENLIDLLRHPNLTHRIPKSWSLLSSTKNTTTNLLVVGAGMSASDCIIAALNANVMVSHVFRGTAETSNIGRKFTYAKGMYSDYSRLVELMKGKLSSNLYQPYPNGTLIHAKQDKSCIIRLQNSNTSRIVELQDIHQVAILIGSTPDLGFVDGFNNDNNNKGEAMKVTNNPLNAYPSVSSTHPQYVNVDPFTMEVVTNNKNQNIYAVGPLRGDNFVRFITNDAWGIAHNLWSRRIQQL